MKALAKIHALTGHKACGDALAKGVKYYLNNLFDADGLPKPFSKAPRLTVYKRELYDCAECINLCLLLRDQFPATGNYTAGSDSGNSERVGKARRLISFASSVLGLGQRSDASLGAVANVSKSRVLLKRDRREPRTEAEDAVRGQKTEDEGGQRYQTTDRELKLRTRSE